MKLNNQDDYPYYSTLVVSSNRKITGKRPDSLGDISCYTGISGEYPPRGVCGVSLLRQSTAGVGTRRIEPDFVKTDGMAFKREIIDFQFR